MQIEPLHTLPLVYELTDPFDSSTYYVRAVVRDSSTGATIETVNLASQGSGRYYNSIIAPQDITGMGRHIDVTISVYTDSGYTTYSDVYQRKIDKYLIRHQAQFFGGGSSGGDIDYTKIEKIVATLMKVQVANLVEALKPEPVDLSKVMDKLSNLTGIATRIANKEPEEPEETDFSSVFKAIDQAKSEIMKSVADKEVTPEAKPVDLSGIEATLANILDVIKESQTMSVSQKEELLNSFKSTFEDISANAKERFKKMADAVLESVATEPITNKPEATKSPYQKYFL